MSAMTAWVRLQVQTRRKGVTGDHSHHLTPEHWAVVDSLFGERLGGEPVMAPLVLHMAAGPATDL